MPHRHHPFSARAFSLIELLVVLGIIALLLAMLLPALTRAREQARRVECLAKLREIGNAATMHVNDHRGFLPTAGWQFAPTGGVVNPAGLDDTDERRYCYYMDDGIKRPMPPTAALAQYLGVNVRTDSRANLESDLADEAMKRQFACPSQMEPLPGRTQHDLSGWLAPETYSSYVFNEALLGRRDKKPWRQSPIAGHIARVKNASGVILMMDGRPRNNSNDRWIMMFDDKNDWTVHEFNELVMYPHNGFGKQLIDRWRHRGMVNALFVDGHCESVVIAEGGLKQLGLSKGLYQ